MGLNMRFCLFQGVSEEQVLKGCSVFYARKGRRLVESGDAYFRYDLHQCEDDWVILNIGAASQLSEWRQQAQIEVSAFLTCKSLLMFVHDGDYWGYQYCTSGEVSDRFLQSDEHKGAVFPNHPANGNLRVLAQGFPWLTPEQIGPYLTKLPELGTEDYLETMKRLDIRVQPQDEFTRFEECAILNFLRLLRVKVEVRSGMVTFLAPVWRTFWIEGRQHFERQDFTLPREL